MGKAWKGKSMLLGFPLTFTSYRLEDGVLTERSGLVSINESQVQLYRVLDVDLKQDLIDNLVDQGTITLVTGNKEDYLVLRNVKEPRTVKKMLNEQIAEERAKQGIRTSEIIDSNMDVNSDRNYLPTSNAVSHAKHHDGMFR